MATDRVAAVEGLKTSRTYGPGCAKLGQKVVIAGGFGKITRRSTEVLDLHSRQKIGGGDMSTPRHHLHLATIRKGREEKAFALGGWDGSTQLNTVEEWVEESSTWKAASSLVNLPTRSTFSVVVIPRRLICPV